MLVAALQNPVFGQASSPAERRAFREYTSPQELVSIAPSTTMDKAFAAISEVSQKFIGKIVVDTDHRTLPINVDVQGMQWRDALDAICRKNDLWYTEFENYIQIVPQPGEGAPAKGGAGAMSASGTTGVGTTAAAMQNEAATFKSREIKISAVFFEVNLDRLEEVGIDWTFMKNTDQLSVAAQADFGGQVQTKIFKTEVTPKVSFANMDFLARVFSSYNLGEVLSGPQLIVRSGEEGRIQVGQDFSVRERDFAGNVIDKFYSAGTIIKVRPQVVTEQGVNFIHMITEVERSSVVPGQLTTIINKTKANTNVLLLDGEETVVGGLYNNETTTIRTGLPFLKDLPWWVFGLRYIFGYDRDQVTKKELVILLKAELVPTLQERITQKTKEDGIFQRWLDDQFRQERHVVGTAKKYD
jgi:type IV pilus assembly protein PilQ